MTNYISLIIVVCLCFLACNNVDNPSKGNKPQSISETNSLVADSTKTSRNNDIIKVAFATGGCEGTCALAAFQIDSSLTISYFGGLFAEKPGFYKGTIDKELWRIIIQKADSLAPKRFNNNYFNSEDDLRMQIVFSYKQGNINIAGSYHELPIEFLTFFEWLQEKVRPIKLTKTNEVINFESTIQYTPGDRDKYLQNKTVG